MSIYCRQCHFNYDVSDIIGVSGDIQALRAALAATDDKPAPSVDEALANKFAPLTKDIGVQVAPWSAVRIKPSSNVFGKFVNRVAKTARVREENQRATLLGAGWDPYCMNLHLILDELAERPFFITIAGEIGASKSHFLIGLLAEIRRRARLGPIADMVPTLRPSQIGRLSAQIKLVYQDKQTLAPTPAETYSDSVVVALEGKNDVPSMNLGFIDVAGEVIRDHAKTASQARFVYETDGIILLLDPGSFPKEGSFMVPVDSKKEIATADIVQSLAANITQVRQRSPEELGVPLVIAVSKSDSVPAWRSDPSTEIAPGDVWPGLRRESDLVREYLVDSGLEAIVSTAEIHFGEKNVAYTRFSALAGDAKDSKSEWKPLGCWKPVAQLLLLTGHFSEQPS